MSRWVVEVKKRDGSGWRQVKPGWARRVDYELRRPLAYALVKLLQRQGRRARMRRALEPWEVWLSGDTGIPAGTSWLHRRNFKRLRKKVGRAARRAGVRWHVNDGLRSYSEQQAAWDRYQAGTGPLAARPGTSNHGIGKAMDVVEAKRRHVNVGDVPAYANALDREGLHLPIASEPWHVTEKGVWG